MNLYDINGNLIELDPQSFKAIKADNSIYALKVSSTGAETSFVTTNHSENLVVLAHISDIHSDPTRYSKVIEKCDQYADYINALIVSGDYVITPTNEEYATMRACETGATVPIYKCVGNHDKGAYSTVMSNADIYTKGGYNTNTGKLYYKVDYAEQKVKVIFLNQYDTTNTSASVAGANSHYSQDQIDWFISELQSAQTNDYAVVIVMHALSENGGTGKLPTYNDKGFYQQDVDFVPNTSKCSGAIIADIVDAFQNGTSLTRSYTYSDISGTINVSASFSNEGKFVCYLCGHHHIDAIGYSQIYPNQLICLITGALIHSDFKEGNWLSRYDLPRFANTSTEIAMNLYGIDPINRLLKVYRIGSDITHKMDSRTVATFEF